MIIKGESVGGAARLATHLNRADQNERVELREIRDLAGRNVREALQEMEALGAGTRTEKPMYHASINTLASERLTDAQRDHAIETLEQKLGLIGQPRIVVIHLKKDREHCHIVWSRIDLERMAAISDSHNYAKHEEVARQLEREFGLTRVQGAHAERDGKPRPKRTPSHAEMLQAERTGLTAQRVTEQITGLWRDTDTGKAFADGLYRAGYILARGDRRDFVVIDPRGGTHSLARRVEGARVKDIRERLADLDPRDLPSVAEAKGIQRERRERGPMRRGASTEAARPDDRPAPEAHGSRSGTHERPQAGALGAARAAASLLDGIAGVFERGLTGDKAQADQQEPAPERAVPEPETDPSTAEAEQKAKTRQEWLREFGREIESEHEAGFERDRQRDRSR